MLFGQKMDLQLVNIHVAGASTPISATPLSNSTLSGINKQLSQARLVAASTPTLVVKMRGRDVLGDISQNLDLNEKSKFLTFSILNRLKINNARKENVNKNREIVLELAVKF